MRSTVRRSSLCLRNQWRFVSRTKSSAHSRPAGLFSSSSTNASRAADEDDYALARDEDAGVDVDTGAPLRRSAAATETYTVSRSSVFRRISVQGGRTARLMRAMARISADLDRALLDLQGEIECDVDT